MVVKSATKKKLTDLGVDEEHAHLLADDRKWDDVKVLNPPTNSRDLPDRLRHCAVNTHKDYDSHQVEQERLHHYNEESKNPEEEGNKKEDFIAPAKLPIGRKGRPDPQGNRHKGSAVSTD